MDYSQTEDELNIILGDSEDVTFTPEEKQRALDRAWNDPYVCRTVVDESLTYATDTFDYALPDTLTTVKDVYYTTSTTDAPELMPASEWEVIDGRIYFRRGNTGYIPDGTTLVLKGSYKLDPEVDTLDTAGEQEYVLALAGANTLTLLTHKKANLFLKNDVSMAELIALKREFQNDVREARMRMQRNFESV